MKKIISIILTAVMLITSMLCVESFAAGSKTEALIDEIAQSRALSISITDGSLFIGNIGLTDLKISSKAFTQEDGTETVKTALTGKFYGYEFRIILGDGDVMAYFPALRIKMNFSSFIDPEILDYIGLYNTVIPAVLEIIDSGYYDSLELTAAGEREVANFGTVYVEEFAADVSAVAQQAVENGEIALPDGVDVSEVTADQIIECVTAAGGDVQAISSLLNTKFEFYYRNGKLVGFDMITVDENGELSGTFGSFFEANIFEINEISANVSEDAFDASGFYFNATFLGTIVWIIFKTFIATQII